MILRSLRAQSFMKYESLELLDLPRGAIAIEGDNEAGKTTIGECVAFALFGRTVRTEETDPAQAIHWDADRAVVQVEFELSSQEGQSGNGNAVHRLPGLYKLERAVERAGAVEARLWAPNGQLLGGNPREVAKALPRVLGFSFPEFRYSFYVAQKELDLVRHATRDNTKRIIYDMLGITAVERARALVTRELDEARERTRTLDRDLVVARALLTEATGDREAGEQALRDREQAEAEAGAAATAEEQARTQRERSVASTDARRDSLTALAHLEGAILAGAHRQRLVQARAQLASAATAAKTQADRAQSILQKDESARGDLRGRLEKARSAREGARALAAIVDARTSRLRAELAQAEGRSQTQPTGGSGHSLGERTARETERAQRLAKARSRRTIMIVLLLLATFALGGMAAALRIPQTKEILAQSVHPIDFQEPLDHKDVHIGAAEAFYGLAFLGSIAFVWTLFVAFGRRGFSAEAAASEADLERLMVGVEKLKSDLAACEAFDTKKLKEIEAKARKIEGDEAVVKATMGFVTAAKDLASSDASPDALVDELQKKLDALDAARAKAEPTANEAGRILRTAQRALEAADAAIDERAKQLPAPPAEDMGQLDLAALDKRVEDAAGAAARARVELDALRASGQDGTVPEGARALMDSLGKVFDGRADAKATFDKQSGLRALLDAVKRGSPAPEDLREALKREREVLRATLGTEEDARSHVAQAEEAYRKARDVRARVDSRLAEARARSERAQVGQTRGQELEVKVAGIESVLVPLVADVAVHEECLHLQEDLVKAMKARFGPEIARYIEVVLPRLTGGRYRKTRLDEDLDLRVFSNERGDYVRLVDISFGTADQVLLALRLGLARALVASRGIKGEHFLFLDEPLASADESRGQAFLELLRSFDDEFAQVFVTSTRPLDGEFARRIELATVTKNVKA